jgi:hypothetical protein
VTAGQLLQAAQQNGHVGRVHLVGPTQRTTERIDDHKAIALF